MLRTTLGNVRRLRRGSRRNRKWYADMTDADSDATTTARHDLPAVAADAGLRLDKFLTSGLPGISRSRLRALIEAGHVTLDGATLSEPSQRVKPGAVYCVDIPPAEPAKPRAEDIGLTIVFEDAHVIVIDKPPGLVVHPAAGHATGTLVNALIAHCGDSLSGIGGVRRPGIVHRLDKDTSGLLVVAKTDAAHKSLSEQFAAHGRDGRLHRAYLAIVWGQPQPKLGRIDAVLGRKPANRTKMAVMRREEEGRASTTHYEVMQGLPKGALKGGAPGGIKGMAAPLASLVRCTLETGRTHQVRVHMAHIGHPLLGDATYGAGFLSSARKLPEAAQDALSALGRQALHAAELAFEHPKSNKIMKFKSEIPDDMKRLLMALG
jgi:23S rRNA pseudouridine1911/1915/1917 synthase